MASIVATERRHLTVTFTYMGIEGYGKVRYRLVCASTSRNFRPPGKTTVQRLARQLGLESFREMARSNNPGLEGQTLTIECTLFAGSTREARNQFTTELHHKIKLY